VYCKGKLGQWTGGLVTLFGALGNRMSSSNTYFVILLVQTLLMKSVTIQIPDSVEINESDLKFSVAAHLYEQRKVSLGEGAMIAEASKRYFIENLGRVGVSIFNFGPDELLEEIANA
jgi:predicted HTH domain antitoxin